MRYTIYMNDARKGSCFRTGFAAGYLKADSTPDRPKLGARWQPVLSFETLKEAKDWLERAGIAYDTSIRTREITGYPVEF